MDGGLREKSRKPNRADLEGISKAHHSMCGVQHQMTTCLERVFQVSRKPALRHRSLGVSDCHS